MRTRILIAAVVTLAAVPQAGAASARATRVPATQRLAVVLTPHVATSRPSAKAPQVQVVQPLTPLTHEQTRLPVLGKYRGPQGVLWLHVLLPGRPNGHTGWIKAPGTKSVWTRWAIVVDLAHRAVAVYRHGALVKRFAVVVGRPSAPTPIGRFYVEESLSIIPGYPGGPYALALSARSNVYSEFDGGPGQIAFHGIFGIGGVPGTAVSHGCIRVDSADMGWLGTHIPPGVPVLIV